MGLYYNGKKVRNLYYNGKCITRLALGKEMTRLVEGDDFVRAEWLVGDGTAYINTLLNIHFATDSVTIRARKNAASVSGQRFFGDYSGAPNAVSLELIYSSRYSEDVLTKYSSNDGRFYINPSGEFEFSSTPFTSTSSVVAYYNGVKNTFATDLIDRYLSYEASHGLMFLNTNDYRYVLGADVAKFIIDREGEEVLHLIPCRLLRPIPATFDGNGIARNADECGMYDLVNGLFYGNVSSGTFTVSDN